MINADTRVYIDTLSLINHKPYKLLNVPLSYTTKSIEIKDCLGVIVPPVYDPDPNETSSWRATIVVMVDMFFNNIPFSFTNHKDMEDIYIHLKAYFTWIDALGTVPNEHKLFVDRAKPFFLFIINRCNRIRAQHQQHGLIPQTFGDVLFSGGLK